MSKWIECEVCGALMEVPAYEGDGAYHDHYCVDPQKPEQKKDDDA